MYFVPTYIHPCTLDQSDTGRLKWWVWQEGKNSHTIPGPRCHACRNWIYTGLIGILLGNPPTDFPDQVPTYVLLTYGLAGRTNISTLVVKDAEIRTYIVTYVGSQDLVKRYLPELYRRWPWKVSTTCLSSGSLWSGWNWATHSCCGLRSTEVTLLLIWHPSTTYLSINNAWSFAWIKAWFVDLIKSSLGKEG